VKSHLSAGYCWRTYFKVLEGLFLEEVFPSFFAFKEGMWDTLSSVLGVRQQYPAVFRDWELGLKTFPYAVMTHFTYLHMGVAKAPVCNVDTNIES
jgi:hypothetical protein